MALKAFILPNRRKTTCDIHVDTEKSYVINFEKSVLSKDEPKMILKGLQQVCCYPLIWDQCMYSFENDC